MPYSPMDYVEALEIMPEMELEEIPKLDPEGIRRNFSMRFHVEEINNSYDNYSIIKVRYFMGLHQTGNARAYIFPRSRRFRFDEFYPRGDADYSPYRGMYLGTFAYIATLLKLLETGLLEENFSQGYPAQTSTHAERRLRTMGLDPDSSVKIKEALEKAMNFARKKGFSFE